MKQKKSIAWKLSALIMGLFLLLFTLYALVTNVMLYNKSIKDAEAYAVKNTELSAAKISDRFKETAEMLRTTKSMVESMQEDGRLTAEGVLNLLEENLAENDHLFGLAMILENGVVPIEPAIDQKFIDREKRFIPYVFKGEGGLKMEGLTGYEEDGGGDWYLVPKRERRTVLTETYSYEVGGKTMLKASFSMPILDKNGTFIGVITADFSIGFLTEQAEKATPESGIARMITDKGFVTADSMDANQIGQRMNETNEWESIKSLLNEGKDATLYTDSERLKERSFHVFAPVMLNGVKEKWSVETVIPQSSILAAFHQTMLVTVLSAVVMVLLMIMATVWFIHRQLKPLYFLKASIDTAATGDLTHKVDESRIHRDEIGTVAFAFNDMLEKVSGVIQTVHKSTLNLNQFSNEMHHAFEGRIQSGRIGCD